jgi:membrane-associated protease RseP (regulator of RpoE activity)
MRRGIFFVLLLDRIDHFIAAGVVATGANLASNEKASLLSFLAVISINVALLNSIPFIPALDGGQMTFLLIGM